MAYYKDTNRILIELNSLDDNTNDGNFSGVGTASEVRTRKMSLDSPYTREIENKIHKIRVLKFKPKGIPTNKCPHVQLEATFTSGHTAITYTLAEDFFTWTSNKDMLNGVIANLDLLFLMQGKIEKLVERNSNDHTFFERQYNEQEQVRIAKENFVCNIGDIVSIYDGYNRCVYLGAYYYTQPNMENSNKPKVHKIYVRLNKDSETFDILNNRMFVEDRIKKDNQPYIKYGHIDIDLDDLKLQAEQHMRDMFKPDIGFTRANTEGPYLVIPRARKNQNRNAFVMSQLSDTRKNTPIYTDDFLNKYAWLCEFDQAVHDTSHIFTQQHIDNIYTYTYIHDNE